MPLNVYLNNDEFWTINEYKGEIYFQSFRSFFIYDGEKVRKGVSDLSPLYIFTLDDHLYVQFNISAEIFLVFFYNRLYVLCYEFLSLL